MSDVKWNNLHIWKKMLNCPSNKKYCEFLQHFTFKQFHRTSVYWKCEKLTSLLKNHIPVPHNPTALTLLHYITLHCIAFPPLKVSQNNCGMWNMSYKHKNILVESNEFWQWCIMLRISEFIDFIIQEKRKNLWAPYISDMWSVSHISSSI
jgi:hypothetical protein